MMKSIHKKTASLTAQFDKIADSLADPDGPIQSFEQKNAAMMTLLKTAYTNFTHSKKAWKVENSRLRDELLEKTDEGISKLNEQTRERLAVTMDRVGKYLSENSELIAGMEGKADHELTEKERLVKNLLATAQKAEQALAGEEAALRGRLADGTEAEQGARDGEARIQDGFNSVEGKMRDTEKYGEEAAYRSEAADADFERDADDKARRFKRGTFALMADLYGEAEKIKDNAHRDEAAVQNA